MDSPEADPPAKTSHVPTDRGPDGLIYGVAVLVKQRYAGSKDPDAWFIIGDLTPALHAFSRAVGPGAAGDKLGHVLFYRLFPSWREPASPSRLRLECPPIAAQGRRGATWGDNFHESVKILWTNGLTLACAGRSMPKTRLRCKSVKSTMRRAAAIAIAAALLASTSFTAATDEPKGSDADEYARMVGVTVAEAASRIDLQDTIGELNARLENEEAATFAGLYVEHSPEYRVVVQFTRDGVKAIRPYVAGGPLESLVQVQEVQYTLERLLQDQASIKAALGDAQYDLDIDLAKNRVEVEVVSTTVFESLASAGQYQLPESATVIAVDHISTPTLLLYGGLALTGCTSGFTIYKGGNTSNRAITTAGHCINQQDYNGTALTYQEDEIRGGSWDTQSHKGPGQTTTYTNTVYDGQCCPYYRSITARKYRANQNVGDFVCKYGKTTHYGCGWIVSKTLAPACISNPYATWIRVDSDRNGTGIDLVQAGDSGGPWFINNVALGTTACEAGFDGVYSAIDYLTGVVLTIS
jgi:hypothetical protein